MSNKSTKNVNQVKKSHPQYPLLFTAAIHDSKIPHVAMRHALPSSNFLIREVTAFSQK